jgi:hypothetical protein
MLVELAGVVLSVLFTLVGNGGALSVLLSHF